MCENKFNIRTIILLSFLLTWAAVAAAHVFYYSVVERSRLNSEGEYFAWREGTLPALRGRILDKHGIELAWTELYHDLVLVSPPERPARRTALANSLASLPFKVAAPDWKSGNVRNLVLRRELQPEMIAACEKLLAEYPELSIEPRTERRSIDYPEVKRLLGKTTQGSEPGVLKGLDGEERLLEKRLAGREGRFQVMLDKNGRWIDGTLKMLEKPVNGDDVCLALSLDDIRYGATNGKL